MRRLVPILFCLSSLSACATGADLSKIDVDEMLTTSSTGGQPAVDETRNSDSVTIRNAVSAADIEALKGAPLSWANADTGSRGTIGSLAETREDSRICRSFTTTRESYNGIGLYNGQTCLGDDGGWYMRMFGEV